MNAVQSELLSPAGTLKNMEYAFAYGADAVYAGQPRYSLRVRNNEFDEENLAKGIARAHELGKKFYVVSNIAAHNAKVNTYMKDIKPIIDMKPDALIMSDPGLIAMVHAEYPEQEIHLSVQSNAVNWATVKFWYNNGVRRVVLSRELSIAEIREIREKVPEMELEVFVHGALCIAYSGRCLLSGYINKRDANQGTCTNACRWNYNTYEAKEDESGDVVGVQVNNVQIDNITDLTGTTGREAPEQNTYAPTLGEGETTDQMMLLEEEGRPGELMPAFEDEHGTYIMNSKDLRAVELIPELVDMGVHSLKIEGRTKSHYYVARTAQVYRKAIDDALAGKEFDRSLLEDLESLASRGYTEGFLRRHVHSEYQNYEYGVSKSERQRFVGEVVDVVERDGRSMLQIDVKNKFCVGDSIEIMTPAGNVSMVLDHMQTHHDEVVDCAKGSGWLVRIPNPFKDLDKETLLFGLIMRNESWGGDVKRDAAARKAKDEQEAKDAVNRAAAKASA
ncbi:MULTISPECIES: tRNA 5-hydroxyuridine modification protein YegQ [Thiomicrorhabdus]|uniref:tRNA 5-hydroxyuridine modification protein YegQ n=1 Tax=Thiomicrorhabdus heinhorstiae TaxID=2748010 RepID=A0ABS0BVC9_9GAMM|nr:MULTISPECIES: tRNA 5-hydroxyuridine modification protein YegQ [Thiomicrorhabdus]MBF6056781.1 tRNA 5-hydroxyuridine modification protein YegQ [Thiomicrorhabdus heinhorstiae]